MEKTKKDYDEIAEEFAATRRTMWPELADLDKYVREGDRVLDVGCGNGKLFGYLSAKIKNFSYVGLDVSEKLIRIARDNYSGEGAEFKVFNGLAIDYPDDYFDTVFCLATLPHLPGESLRLEFLQSIGKKVKSGAILVITCWNLWQPKFIRYQIGMTFNFIIDKLSGKGQYDWGDFYIPWHKQNGKIIKRFYHALTLSELNGILKKTGWEVEELGCKKRHGKKNFNLFAAARK